MEPRGPISPDARFEELERKLERMEQRLQFLYSYFRLPFPDKTAPLSRPVPPSEPDEELIHWAGRTFLLSRGAALCFLLVLAFVLRALTDGQIWDVRMGSWVGISYCGLLVLGGALSYRRRSPLAVVLSACGILFAYSIVLEGHERLKSIDTMEAYLVLAGAGVSGAAMARIFSARGLGTIGIVGMSLTAALLGHPYPNWPLSMGLMLLAVVISSWEGFSTKRAWPRWLVMAGATLSLAMWSSKITHALRIGETHSEPLSSLLFLPFTGLFLIVISATSLWKALSWKSWKISVPEALAPAMASALAYLLAREVLSVESGELPVLGLAGTSLAAVHLLIVWPLAKKEAKMVAVGFSLAGVCLLGMALPDLLGSLLPSLPLISSMGILFLALARRWGHGPLRVFAHLIQTYPAIFAGLWLWDREISGLSTTALVLVLLVFLVSSSHYLVSRKEPPEGLPPKALWEHDPKDLLALLPLSSSVFCALSISNLLCYPLLAPIVGGRDGLWISVQTGLLSSFTMALCFFGYLRRLREVRNLAILLGIVLVLKIVFIDLFQGRGLALVLSFFWLGMAALVQSVVLSRWQRSRSKEGSGLPS